MWDLFLKIDLYLCIHFQQMFSFLIFSKILSRQHPLLGWVLGFKYFYFSQLESGMEGLQFEKDVQANSYGCCTLHKDKFETV